jgi:two-component system CheB/CheR fusion protein
MEEDTKPENTPEYVVGVGASAGVTPVIDKPKSNKTETSNELVATETGGSSRTTELEEELKFTKESLQTTVEELETTNVELQSSNEELQSTNEELQSVNEELVTVNSEYKRKEREKAKAEADEKSIVDVSGVGILFLDEQLRVRKFSDTAAEIFHLVDADYDRPFQAISGRFVESITSDISHVLQEGGIVEKEILHENNSAYQVRIHRLETIETNGEEESRGIIITLLNITKSYFSQKNLKQSEQRFQTIVDALTDGYFEYRVKDESLYLSQGFRSKLGYSEEEILKWSDIISEDSARFIEEILETKDGKIFEKTIALLQPNGEKFWVLCKGRYKEGDSDTKSDSSIEGQFINMQNFKELEKNLQNQMNFLKHSNNLLEDFAHIVSHDLKAPLRHAQHNLEFLKEAMGNKNETEAEQQVLELKGNLHSLQSLIDDVIRFSRCNAQKKSAEKVDLHKVFREVKEVILGNFRDLKKIELICDDLPSLHCDQSMMKNLFQNLLHNACKYNESEIVKVNINTKINEDSLEISFKDNGIGFDSRFTDEVFKPFKRLVQKDKYEGSGIGLAICKTIMDQHNGHISVKSKPGKGSEFILSLPLSENGRIN